MAATHHRPARLLAGIVIAGLTAAWAVGQVVDHHVLAGRDRQEVAQMTHTMKTVCVGRFLIDLPLEAQVSLDRASIDGLSIAAFAEPRAEFLERVAARRRQLETTPDRLGGSHNLEQETDVMTPSGMDGKIFIHGRTVLEGTQANGLEVGRFRDESVAVEALIHGSGISIDLSYEHRDPAKVDDLARLVAKAVPNPDNRIPSEPGFCIDNAYFRDPLPADQNETIMMVANLPTHPDVDFSLILMAGTEPDAEGLLARRTKSDLLFSLIERSFMTDVRAAPRTIGHLAGDELVQRVLEKNDTTVYSFWWEVIGTRDDVMTPHLSFTMDTGSGAHGAVPSSLSEGAALALWDRVVSSIRPRPAETAPAGVAAPPPVALGTVVSAGERCPASGWWHSGDGGNGVGVLGGERQFIRQGERMPQALLLPPPALWQRLRGLQPSFESATPTAWKLVDQRQRDRTVPALPLAAAMPAAPFDPALTAGAAPPGSLVATGAACPASGWWRCEDANALDGTRWFAHGSLLPPATFAVPPGVFGRAAGRAPSSERRSTWRLMRLATQREAAPGGGPRAGSEGSEGSAAAPGLGRA